MGLGTPWAAEVVEDLQKGLALLDQIAHTTQRLSVPYSERIEQLNVTQLQRKWAKAEKALWPMSWLAKRKARSVLDAAVTGEGEPDVTQDLRSLVRIRALRSKVTALGWRQLGNTGGQDN